MKNKLGIRIKELRTSFGFSQEELSEKSGLSLRTIQRIENGETEPRGDSLKRLAMSLRINSDELLDWSKQEDKGQLLLLNISGLSFVLNPFLGLIIPLAIWVSKKDKVAHVDENGKQLINFQISCLLFLIVSLIGAIVYAVVFLKMEFGGTINSPFFALVVILILAIYYLYGIFVIIRNVFRIQAGTSVKYKPSIKLIK